MVAVGFYKDACIVVSWFRVFGLSGASLILTAYSTSVTEVSLVSCQDFVRALQLRVQGFGLLCTKRV